MSGAEDSGFTKFTGDFGDPSVPFGLVKCYIKQWMHLAGVIWMCPRWVREKVKPIHIVK